MSYHKPPAEPSGPPEHLIKKLWKVCVRVVMSKGASRDEAEQVAQETLLAVLNNWDTKKFQELRASGEDRVVAYVTTMAKNRLIDEIRKYDRRTARERFVGSGGDPLQERPNVIRPHPQPRDTEGVETYMALESVKAMINSLPSLNHRVCLWYVYGEGYTAEQVGELVGKHPQTIRKYLREGLAQLHKCISGQSEQKPPVGESKADDLPTDAEVEGEEPSDENS